MDIKHRIEGDVTIVGLDGRLDWNSLSEFSGTLAQYVDTGSKKVLLDFSKTEYMSSAGIRALIEAMQSVESKGGVMAICSPSESLKELFQVVQLDKIIKIYPSELDAVDKMMG